VRDSAVVRGSAVVRDSAVVRGTAFVRDTAVVRGSAKISKDNECVVIAGFKFSATVTPQNVSIGCYLWTHENALKVTKEQALAAGLPEREWKTFRAMILLAMKQVKQ